MVGVLHYRRDWRTRKEDKERINLLELCLAFVSREVSFKRVSEFCLLFWFCFWAILAILGCMCWFCYFKFFFRIRVGLRRVLDIYIPLSLLLFFIWVFELRVDIVDVYSLLFGDYIPEDGAGHKWSDSGKLQHAVK